MTISPNFKKSLSNSVIVLAGLLTTVVAHAESLTVSFEDPLSDFSNFDIDLTGMTLNFDNLSGDYELLVFFDAANPFQGTFNVNANLLNGSIDPLTTVPAFVNINEIPTSVAPTTLLTLVGTDSRLMSWNAGDSIANNSSIFGLPIDATFLGFSSGVQNAGQAIDGTEAAQAMVVSVPDLATTFSIVIIPDSQSYAEENPEILEAQVQWIVDNAGESDENIVYVAQLGDLKDNDNCFDVPIVTNGSGNSRSEWQIVSEAFGRLDTAGIPYGVVPGNHDFDQRGGGCPNYDTQRPLTVYNDVANFNPSRYAADAWYGNTGTGERGNRVDGSNEDNFTLFSGACGINFISINLAFKEVSSGRTNGSVCADLSDLTGDGCEIEWADSLLKDHSDRLGIITSHNFLKENAQGNLNTFGGDYGLDVFDRLANNANLAMMLSAHNRGEAWLQATAGRGSAPPVHAILSNYQSSEYPDMDVNFYRNDGGSCVVATEDGPGPGGDDYYFDAACTNAVDFSDLDVDRMQGSDGGDGGFMRIMRFDTATQMVSVETFAPAVDFTGLTYDDDPTPDNRDIVLRSNIELDPAQLRDSTASNFSFSLQGYGSPVIAPNCTP